MNTILALLFLFFLTFIFYAYLGYPLLLAILAYFRPAQRLSASLPTRPLAPITPHVSLVIAAYNEEAYIRAKLENTLALDYPAHQLQIIVAADGSDDQTPEIVQEFGVRGVELSYSLPRRGKLAALNRAIPRVRGSIIVFSDANNMYEPQTLRELVKPFADPRVGMVSGAKTILCGDGTLGDSEGLYWKYESFIKSQQTRLGTTACAPGEVMAIRRDLFENTPNHIINDDMYLSFRIIARGYNVAYAPLARSYERVSASAQDEIDRRARMVCGHFQLMGLGRKVLPLHRPLATWHIISHKFIRPLTAPVMVAALITNLLALLYPKGGAWSLPLSLFTLGLQLLFYALAWVGNQMAGNGRLRHLLYLPTFLVNSNRASLIGLYRFLTRRQTTLWQRVNRRKLQQSL